MSKVELDQILDNDRLTTAQERVIRRTVPHKLYKFFNTDTQAQYFSLVYRIKGGDPTKHYELDFPTLDIMRMKSYKMVMWDLIKIHSYKMTDAGVIEEMIKLIERNLIQEPDHHVLLCFGTGKNFMSPTHFYIKSHVLFKILQVMNVLK